MSIFKPTTQQQAIIHSQGENILVSASAGTGKTRVMIERILHMISQGERLRHMLVVTFTEKAAMEMRQRLEERRSASRVGDMVYLHAISELPLANISTLHGFCLKMVRRYAYLIDLDQNPVILTELEAEFMKEKVRQELLEDCLGRHRRLFVRWSVIMAAEIREPWNLGLKPRMPFYMPTGRMASSCKTIWMN